jgi:hypothetical protein
MLTSILQYSTIDIRFLEPNLIQLSKFSDEIIIPICKKLFDGTDEDPRLIDQSVSIIDKFESAKIHFFDWYPYDGHMSYYHNLSRQIGTDLAKNDWLLFVDADEVFEDYFKIWFESITNDDIAWVFKCHWYFREPMYRAIQKESAGFLVKKKYCTWELENKLERQQLYQRLWDEKKLIHGDIHNYFDKNIFLHHFSWVRDKQQMLKKVQNWGHKDDKDWTSLVNEEFSREFNGTDFVHGYQYEIVDNKFKI